MAAYRLLGPLGQLQGVTEIVAASDELAQQDAHAAHVGRSELWDGERLVKSFDGGGAP